MSLEKSLTQTKRPKMFDDIVPSGSNSNSTTFDSHEKEDQQNILQIEMEQPKKSEFPKSRPFPSKPTKEKNPIFPAHPCCLLTMFLIDDFSSDKERESKNPRSAQA
jgi:hypothetical protein